MQNENNSTFAGAGYLFAGGLGAELTAAATITLTSALHVVSGSTTITTINGGDAHASNIAYLLKKTGATWQLGAGGNIVGSIPSSINANSVVTLVWDQTSWRVSSVAGTQLFLNPMDYGALGNGTTDDTAAWASCISDAGTLKQPIFFPGKTFSLTAAATRILLATKPIQIIGCGYNSVWSIAAGTPNTVKVLEVSPAVGATDGTMLQLQNFRIIGGGATGGDGITLTATASGQFLRRFIIDNVSIDALGGNCISVDASGAGAGIFTATIQRCLLGVNSATKACVAFNTAYDSLAVENCTLTGTGYSFLGNFIPGAGRFNFGPNNSCTASSGFRINGTGPSKGVINGNYFEQAAAYTGANSAIVDLDGAMAAPMGSTSFVDNLVAVITGTIDCLRVNWATDTFVDGNQFTSVATKSAVNITANATGTRLGSGNVYGGAGTPITNAGTLTTATPTMLYSAVADSTAIANTAVATVFSKSFTIPANTLRAGDVLTLAAKGVHSTTGTPTVTMELLVAGQIMGASGLATGAGVTNNPWDMRASVVVRAIGATGTLKAADGFFGLIGGGSTPNGANLQPTVDTTATIACQVRWTWSAASASNTSTLQTFNVFLWRAGTTS